MSHENTNWGQSVTGVVLQNGKVLLARHTYGAGKGMYIVPGGYVEYNESPQDALIREYLEETNIQVEPKEIIAVRFNNHVPALTKQLINCAVNASKGLEQLPYEGNPKHGKGYLYGK